MLTLTFPNRQTYPDKWLFPHPVQHSFHSKEPNHICKTIILDDITYGCSRLFSIKKEIFPKTMSLNIDFYFHQVSICFLFVLLLLKKSIVNQSNYPITDFSFVMFNHCFRLREDSVQKHVKQLYHYFI